MVDNAVRIKISATLDDGQIAKDLASLQKKASIKIGIDPSSIKNLTITPKLDTEAISRQLDGLFSNRAINLATSGGGKDNCCDRLAGILDGGLSRIEGGISRIESQLNKLGQLQDFKSKVKFESKDTGARAELSKELAQESQKTAKESVKANRLLEDIKTNTRNSLIQSAASGFAIGGGQALFKAAASRLAGGQQEQPTLQSILGGSKQGLASSLGKTIAAQISEVLKNAISAQGILSPRVVDQLAVSLRAPIADQVQKGISIGIDKASGLLDKLREKLSPRELQQFNFDAIIVDAASDFDDVTVNLEAINQALEKTGDILDNTSARILPSDESIRLVENLKSTLDGLRNVDIALEPEKAAFLAANFEKISQSLKEITRLQIEQIPLDKRALESAAKLRGQQASVAKTIKAGQRVIATKGIQVNPALATASPLSENLTRDIQQSIQTQLEGAREAGKIIGIEILGGISQGLAPEELQEPANAVAFAIQEGIKEPLEIASPSKWAERVVGKNIIEGIERGISKNFGSLKSVAEDLSQTIQSGLSRIRGVGRFINQAISLAPAAITIAQIGAISTAIIGLARATIPAALALASVKRQLISVGRTDTGRIIANFSSLANEVGASIEQTLQGFARFATVTKNTVLELNADQVFGDLVTGFASAGAGAQEQARAFTALEQILSKTVVQAEELRGQLAEALPQSIGIAARAIGKTERELFKLVQSGELLAEEFIPAFAAQFARETALLGDLGFEAPGTNLQRIQNRLTAVAQIIGGKFVPTFNTGLKVINSGLEVVVNSLDKAIQIGIGVGGAVLIPSFIRLGVVVQGLAVRFIQATQSLLAYARGAQSAASGNLLLNRQLLTSVAAFARFGAQAIIIGALFQRFNEGAKDIELARRSAINFNKEVERTAKGLQNLPKQGVDLSLIRQQFEFGIETGLGADFLTRIRSLLDFSGEFTETRKQAFQAASAVRAIEPNQDAVANFNKQIENVDLNKFRAELRQVDVQAAQIRTELSEASRVGDTKEVERLQKALGETIKQSLALKENLRDAVGIDPFILERNLDLIQDRINDISETTPGLFTRQELALFNSEIDKARINLEQGADALNEVLGGTKGRIFTINLVVEGVERGQLNRQFLNDTQQITREIEIASNNFSATVNQIFSTGLTQNKLLQDIQFSAEQIQRLTNLFDPDTVAGISAIQNVATKLGVTGIDIDKTIQAIAETISPETIQRILDTEGEGLDAGLKKNLEVVQRITELRQQQLGQQKELADINAEIIQLQQQQITSLRTAAEQGFGTAVQQGFDTAPFTEALGQIGELTAGEIAGVENSVQLLGLIAQRQVGVANRVEQQIAAERGRFETQIATDFARQIQDINTQISSGAITPEIGEKLRTAAELQNRLAISTQNAELLRKQLQQIDSVAQGSLITEDARSEALAARRRELVSTQQELNALLGDGASQDSARVKLLQIQLAEIEKIINLLESSPTGLDAGQRGQLIADVRRQLAEAERESSESLAEGIRIESEAAKQAEQERIKAQEELTRREKERTEEIKRQQEELVKQKQQILDLSSTLASAVQANARVGSELELFRLERDGASDREIFEARLRALSEERGIELELLRIDQQRQIVAAKQLQIESQISLNKAKQEAISATRRAVENPGDTLAQLEAQTAAQGVRLAEQQVAIANVGLSQIGQLIGIQLDTFNKQFVLDQERLLAQAEEQGIAGLRPGNIGVSNSQIDILRALQLAIGDVQEGQPEAIAKAITREQGNAPIPLDTRPIREIGREALDRLVEASQRVDAQGGFLGAGDVQKFIQNQNEILEQAGRSAIEFQRGNELDAERNSLLGRLIDLNTPDTGGGRFISESAGASLGGGLGGFNTGTLGADLVSRVARGRGSSVPNRIPRGETARRSQVNVGDINISLELADTQNNPDLGTDIANQVITRIAETAEQLA